ncbi:MAG: 16S rRNA (cytosine(967)-C(5))-methyltransferase RsmB [Proteobacteria bacterium]|nr:16S rRNA (cytosine(967)-C(5))-methyltransferase RsmB [Pseudomonadota bacterium]
MPDDARYLAVSILNAITENPHLTLDNAIDTHESSLGLLSRKDRAFFNALVFGVIRWRNHLDHIIRFLSTTPVKKINPMVLNVLRICIFQLKFMDRVPPSAAVNTSVELVKKALNPAWIVKFTNGLLRNAVRKLNDIPFPEYKNNPALYLSVHQSFPEWMIKRWIARYGIEQTLSLCVAMNDIPPLTLRVNALKINRNELLDMLNQQGFDACETIYSPVGITLKGSHDSVTRLPGFEEGLFQVQDEAAQLVTLFLNPQPIEKVLDACAGLGGKTAHMAELMDGRGMILATDLDEQKLVKLKHEANRLGIQMIDTACEDMSQECHLKDHMIFDRVLVDAPCSGLGVIRRNPDIKWHHHKKNLERYRKRQVCLLENAASLVRPGGIVVFAVCSTEPEENEQVVRAFLEKNPSFILDNDLEGIHKPILSLVTDDGYLQTGPQSSGMDGFFAARLKKQSIE